MLKHIVNNEELHKTSQVLHHLQVQPAFVMHMVTVIIVIIDFHLNLITVKPTWKLGDKTVDAVDHLVEVVQADLPQVVW